MGARKVRFPFTGSATTGHVGGVVETALMAVLTSIHQQCQTEPPLVDRWSP